VRVEDYDLPAFRVAVTPDRSYYAPGDPPAVTVDAAYFFGMPVVGGDVILRAYEQITDGRLVAESRGVTDAQGRAELRLDLPSDLADGRLVLEAQIVDSAGQVAGIRQVVPVSEAPLLVRAMPESGVLKPGVENDVFLMATTPDGLPAAAELVVMVDAKRYELRTDAFGLAVLQLIPSGDTELVVEARDAAGNEATATLRLRADGATQALLLHTAKAIYEVGETLQATALVVGDSAGPVFLDVVQEGRMVATLSAGPRGCSGTACHHGAGQRWTTAGHTAHCRRSAAGSGGHDRRRPGSVYAGRCRASGHRDDRWRRGRCRPGSRSAGALCGRRVGLCAGQPPRRLCPRLRPDQ